MYHGDCGHEGAGHGPVGAEREEDEDGMGQSPAACSRVVSNRMAKGQGATSSSLNFVPCIV